MAGKKVAEIAEEAMKIYFERNISVEEAIERAKEELSCSKKEKCGRSY